MGKKLLKLITIGNLYRPPRDNNNNINIESFIGEITSIVDEIVKQCAYALVLGDFSIYLLQINEREKFNDFPIWCALTTYTWKSLYLHVLPTDHAA